jgi:DNA segregation ATPase FtsK/SpoIIIE-like protein
MFLLPTFGYGLFLFLSTGSAVLLVLSILTFGVWLVIGSQRKLNSSEPVSVKDQRIYVGDRRLNLFPWSWGVEIRNLVYSYLYAETKPVLNFDNLPATALGLTSNGEAIYSPIGPKNPHALLIGQTGAGKSQLLRRIIAGFDSDIWIVDFKGGADFQGISASEMFLEADVERATAAISLELQSRGKCPAEPLLLVVDELSEALRHPRLAAAIELVAAKGRSLGIHFVGASQTMTGIPRSLWVNCHCRFALRADSVDRSVLGMPPKALHDERDIGYAELWLSELTQIWFPFGAAGNQESEIDPEPTNPFLVRVDARLPQAPSEESALSPRTPVHQWSVGVPPEPPDYPDHRLWRRDHFQT